MKIISFFDAKPYDKIYFDRLKGKYNFAINYFEVKLNDKTVVLAKESDAVVVFVNDFVDKKVIDKLCEFEIKIVAMRCAGYNNVDVKYALGKVHIVRVPAYSPHAIAEYTMGIILTLNRKLHRAVNRIKEYNFSLNGLIGFDLCKKTIGIVGTGKIGKIVIDICKGFDMSVIAYDLYPDKNLDVEYVSFKEICQRSDIISLHCPLTKETHYMINEHTIKDMKSNVMIINTSRGHLINSEDLVQALKSGKVYAAGLDVYEEETDLFYEDFSNTVIKDDILVRLISMPNVIVTSHQAFLTDEALYNIAEVTLENLLCFFEKDVLQNEIVVN